MSGSNHKQTLGSLVPEDGSGSKAKYYRPAAEEDRTSNSNRFHERFAYFGASNVGDTHAFADSKESDQKLGGLQQAISPGLLKQIGISFVGMGLGLSITILFLAGKESELISFEKASESVSMQMTNAPVAPPVQSEIFVVPPQGPIDDIEVRPSGEVLNQELVDFALSKPARISPREFLYYGDTQRFVGATLSESKELQSAAKKPESVSPRSLEVTAGDDRFVSKVDNTEWQGGFTLSNPERNIARGESYSNYVNQQNTNSIDSLKVIQSPRNRLLNTLKEKQLRPHTSNR